MRNANFEAVCRFFGSQQKTAGVLGVTVGAVNHVVAGRRKVPARWCPIIERETCRRFLCEKLRPDIDWTYLRLPEIKES